MSGDFVGVKGGGGADGFFRPVRKHLEEQKKRDQLRVHYREPLSRG